MITEDDLRAALREDVGEVTPLDDGWEDVVARVAVHTRRRKAVRYPIIGVAAAAAVVAIIASVVVLRSSSESEAPNIATPSAAPMPTEIVVSTSGESVTDDNDGEILVLDSTDGHIKRTLARGYDSGTVSVAGGYVYFTRLVDKLDDPTCEWVYRYGIERVPLSGGPTEAVAPGIGARVSPDGRWLAYSTYAVDSPPCAPARDLAIRDLTSGAERRFTTTEGRFPGLAIAWTPDSSKLLYEQTVGENELTYHLLDATAEAGSLDDAGWKRLNIPESTAVEDVAPDGSLLVQMATSPRDENLRHNMQMALVDPDSGQVIRSVIDLGKRVALYVALDTSGRHVVYAVDNVSPEAPYAPASLERITIGDQQPIRLQTNVHAVAWGADDTPPSAGTVAPVTTATFENDVLRSDVPVVVEFWAPWCVPCSSVATAVEQIAAKGQGSYRVVRVNIDDEPLIAQQYAVSGIPEVGLFRYGRLVRKAAGTASRQEIEAALGLS